MRAIILATTYDAALGNLTKTRPAALLELGGMTVLDWQLRAFRAAGVEEVAIVGGYCAERLRAPQTSFFHHANWAATGEVLALRTARTWLTEADCIIARAGMLFHPDHVLRLSKQANVLTLLFDRQWESLWQDRFDAPEQELNGLVLDAEATIRPAIELAPDLPDAVHMGLTKVTPTAWQEAERLLLHLSPSVHLSMDLDELWLRLSEVNPVGIPADGQWCPVQTEDDLVLYNRQIRNSRSQWQHDWRWTAA